MRVTLTPNGGEHEIVVDKIVLKNQKQVDDQIRYLHTVKKMLWQEAKKQEKPE